MEFDLLGQPEDRPRLRLDYRQFTYAGRFATMVAGKMVLHDPNDSLLSFSDSRPTPTGGLDSLPPLAKDMTATVTFNEGQANSTTLWPRYVTVRRDRRGDRLGPDLLRRTCDVADHGCETARTAASNPFAYEACHKVGFGFTGRETGIAGLVLECPAGMPAAVSHEAYQSGLDRYRACDLGDPERASLVTREGVEPLEVDAGHSDD